MMRNSRNRKNQNKSSSRQRLERQKEMIVESLQLPKDTLLGASIVTVTGNTDAFIENYRGILEYTQETIVLQGKTCQISIQGQQLSIDYYTNEDMKISGCIDTIQYHYS